MRVDINKMEDGVNPDSEEHVTPAAKTVEAGCPICLESFKDKSFVDVCFHILINTPVVALPLVTIFASVYHCCLSHIFLNH